MTPGQYALRVDFTVVVGHEVLPEGEQVDVEAGDEAPGAAGLAPVRNAQGVREPDEVVEVPPPRPLADAYRLDAVLVDYLLQPYGYGIQGLVPPPPNS